MILNPWVIALYISLVGSMLLYLYALFNGAEIISGWNVASMEEKQLVLERKSYLASTIIQYGFGVQVLSLVLFYMVLDSVAELIPGAMCATGALKANEYGFPALFAKMAVGFICFGWIILHHMDTKLEDYALTKLKFKGLLILLPLMVSDLVLQFLYFSNLDPGVITSCCGVVFEVEGEGFGSSLASLAPNPMMAIFFISGPLFISWGYLHLKKNSRFGNYAYSVSSLSFLIFSILSIISFIAPYVYEMPTLHCPFNILRKEYHYIGYPMYVLLFTAGLFSVVPGLTEPLKRKGGPLRKVVEGFQRKVLRISLICWTLFFMLSALPIIHFQIRSEGGHLF